MARGRLDLPIVTKFDKTGLQQAKDAFGGFGKNLAGIGAAVAAAFSVRAITNFAKEAVLAAEGVATANARIGQIAKSTGLFGDQTEAATQRMIDFAEANELRLAVDAEVIKGVQAQLLTFKALGQSADETGGIFDRTTEAAFNMAAAGFGSAESNATQLGKALEDPVRGLSALRKSGTTFTEEQQDLIASLVETGDLAGAQEVILGELEAQYGGVAEATADASDRMGLAFDNIKEAAGAALLPIFAQLAEDMMPVMDEIAVAVGDAFTELGPVLTDIAGLIPGLVQAFLPMIPIIGEIAALFLEIVAQALPFFVELFEQLLPTIMELAPVLADVFLMALKALLPVFMALIEALLPIVEALLPVILDMIMAFAPLVITLIEAFLPLIEMVLPYLIQFIQFLIPLLVELTLFFSEIIIGAINLLIEGITWLTENWAGFGLFFQELWTTIANFFIGIVNGMLAAFEGFINFVIDGLNAMIRALNSLRFKVPDWVPNIGGKQFGFSIPSLSNVSLPRIPELAEGGIVDRRTLAVIGEAGPEAVVPLDKFDMMGSTINITVNAGLGTDGAAVGREIVSAIRRYERTSGKVFANA